MPLFLNASIARRRFKGLLGNANHLLITILVGLSAVERGLISQAPGELHAAWNPKDPRASADRSRIMVLEMTLVRATDALDSYIAQSRREPSLIQDQNVKDTIDGSGQGVAKRLGTLISSLPPLDRRICALVEVMIAWRNKSVHSLADTVVRKDTRALLQRNESWLKDEFRGMELSRLLSDFDRGGPPTFKEIASLIRATQELVRELDEAQLKQLDLELYLRAFIWDVLGRGLPNERPNETRARLAQSTWGRDASERLERVTSMLRNNGLSNSCVGAQSVEFSDGLLQKVSAFTPKEILEYTSPECR